MSNNKILKLFRKIRKKLVLKNNLRKYFIYAIGEIILIVMGIFIGLKLDEKYDRIANSEIADKYLKEIIIDLKSDVIELDNRIVYLEKDTKAREVLLKTKKLKDLETNNLYKMILGTNLEFKINTTAYDKYKALNTSNFLTENSLNSAILNYYDFEVKNFNSFTSWLFDSYKKQNNFLLYQQNQIDLTGNSNFDILSKSQKNRRNKLIKFIESTQGANLIIDSYYSEKRSLEVFKGFRKVTIDLLNLVQNKLKVRE